MNFFNPELQFKDTESVIKNKLKQLLAELKGFKFVTTLVLKFEKTEMPLTLIWVGFLGVRFGVGGGVKLPRLKLVKIKLEISNLARKYTHIHSLRKYTF